LRGPCHGEFALRVSDAREASGCQDERIGEGFPQQRRGGIDRSNVTQDPGPKSDASIAIDVGRCSAFVFGGSVDVVEDAARKPTAGNATQIGNVGRGPYSPPIRP
jgi:hypothetical protein